MSRFRIYFPSIAVAVTREIDSTGREKIVTMNDMEYNKWMKGGEFEFKKIWREKLESCIRSKDSKVTDFTLSIAPGSLSDAYLFDVSDDGGRQLVTPDKNSLYTKDFFYYSFPTYIQANKEDIEKLFSLDYSDCINEEERNRPEVIAKMKELVKQSTTPTLNVDKGEVGLSGFQDAVTKSHNKTEQEYSLWWYEIEKN